MNKEELLVVKQFIGTYKKDAFDYQEENGFELIFDELYDSIYEIEKIVDDKLKEL